MSTTPAKPAGQEGIRIVPASRRKVLLLVLLAPLIALVAVEANTVRLEQLTEQKRREIGAAGGRCELQRRVPAWLQPVFGENFHTFFDHTAIVGVTMRGAKVGDEQIAEIKDVPDLVRLDLEDASVSSAGLKSVSEIKSLMALNLVNTQVTDLTELTKLPALETLWLNFCPRIKAEHLPALANVPRLRTLGLGGARVTDDGVAALANCSQIEVLNLDGANLSDSGLRPLHALTRLKRLTLIYAKYSPADLDAFRQAVPDCQIVK